MTTDSRLIAFLGYWSVDDSGTAGTLMVTNEQGYPLEFRVTAPVRATAIQEALYGDSLERYVNVELIGKLLVSQVQRRPFCCLTNLRTGIELEAPFPIVYAASADEVIVESDARTAFQRLDTEEASIGLLARDSSAVAAAVDCLRDTARYFDPIATFERMGIALNVLRDTDPRYR